MGCNGWEVFLTPPPNPTQCDVPYLREWLVVVPYLGGGGGGEWLVIVVPYLGEWLGIGGSFLYCVKICFFQ